MIRYSLINSGMKREFILLQGKGCKWKKCTFCDYYEDYSDDPYVVNEEVLNKVTGVYKTLDIINSGSCFEFDDKTISKIQDVVKKKNIETLWFECHYMYKDRLNEFRSLFPNTTVKFRCGVETFNALVRASWNKGIGKDVKPEEIAKYFNGICLLTGIKGQSIEDLKNDIDIAEKYFEYYSLNLFCKNSTDTVIDENLASYVRENAKNLIKGRAIAELLIENTDLGVG